MPWVTGKNGTRRFYYRLSREYGRRRIWINDPIAAEFISQNEDRGRNRSRPKPGSLRWLFAKVTHRRPPAKMPDKDELKNKREKEQENGDQGSH